MTEARDRRKSSYQVLLVTLWLTLLVLAVKVWAGLATQSLSLLAESLHTLIDCFSTILSLVAISTSPYRPSGREMWTHTRRETAAVLLLVAFMGFSGFSLLISAFQQLQAISGGFSPPSSPTVTLPLVQLLGLVVGVNICLVLFERYEARRLESQALRLNANHILKDAWLTVLVLLGLIGVSSGYIWIDAVMSIALVLLLIRSSWRVFNWQLPLMVQQVAIAPEAISYTVCQVEGVTHCRHIRSRGIVGRQVFIELTILLHPEFLGASQVISEQVEAALRERFGPLQAKIHVDGISASSPPSQSTDLPPRSKVRRSNPNWN